MLRTLLALSLAALLVACARTPTPSQPAPGDRGGTPRIISLVPSFTEDLFAIGAGPDVVGVSKFSDTPAAARRLPRVSDFSSVDVERIVALHPSAVVAIPSLARLLTPLQRAGIDVQLIDDDKYHDIFRDITLLGSVSGHSAQAAHLIAALKAQTQRLHARTLHFKRHPSVFIALGSTPIWTAGSNSYIGRLIALAGGRNAAEDLRQPWGEYSAEALVRKQPDVIIAGDETHLAADFNREPWRSLRAVREHHIYFLRDSDLLFRPGPRYNEGLLWLIQRLTPLAR